MSSEDKEPIESNPLQAEVHIDNAIYEKIMYWINKSDYEVSGLGTVVYDEEDGVFKVTEAFLIKQENTTVTTELDGLEISKLMAKVHKNKDIEGTLNFWWHSHVDMDVYWSPTDIDTIRSLGKHGWFLSTVFNKREEMRSAFYQKAGFAVFADNLETTITYPYDYSREEEWDAEYEEKVTISALVASSWKDDPIKDFSRFNDDGDSEIQGWIEEDLEEAFEEARCGNEDVI